LSFVRVGDYNISIRPRIFNGLALVSIGHFEASNEAVIAMTTPQLLQAAKNSLESLPPEQLKVAAEFLRYLEERASDQATEELLKIPGLLEDLAEAERDIAEGQVTPVEKLRRKYDREA
jgi:hypothetical protein